MAKLVLSMDGLVLKEIALAKERVTIGRKPHNDIQIDNLAVSGEHAVVVTILSDSFLEDLGSTNGTQVNGMPIRKHFLQNNDVIELGKYKLKYVSDNVEERPQDFEKTMVLRPQIRPEAAVPEGVATFGGGETPPAGLVDTAQSASTQPNPIATSVPPAQTAVTQPLPQPLSIMVTQPAPGMMQRRGPSSRERPGTSSMHGTSRAPGTAGMPGSASMPGTLSAPGTSSMPAAAKMPATSSMPGTANMPGAANMPGTVSMPGAANTPGSASMPGAANTPGTPNMPGSASMPGSKRDGLPAATEGRSTPEPSAPGALKRPPTDLPADGPASRANSEGTQPASSPQARVDGAQAAPGASAPALQRSVAAIQILTGSNAGRELDLTKPLTTLGRPQVQVAVITKRAQGYFITHVEGEKFPTINGKAIDAQAQVLKDHDVIELAGVKMEFYYKE